MEGCGKEYGMGFVGRNLEGFSKELGRDVSFSMLFNKIKNPYRHASVAMC